MLCKNEVTGRGILRAIAIITIFGCLSVGECFATGGGVGIDEVDRQQYQLDLNRVNLLNESLRTGKVRDLKQIQRFADDIDITWSNRNKECRARLLLEICMPLSSGTIKDNRRYEVARKCALSALDSPDMIPLALELELIGHVLTVNPESYASTGEIYSQSRKEDVRVRLHAWKRLVDAIDPKWSPDEAMMGGNIEPPITTGLPSGVEPQSISDPGMRAEYESEIQRNRRKNERSVEQYRLHDWLKRYPKRAEEYIIEAYSQPPFFLEELKQELDIYLVDKGTKTRIIDTVEKNIKSTVKRRPAKLNGV